MSVRLKNESKRSFQFGVLKGLKVFKPGEVAIFDDETAAILLKQRGVIDIDNIKIDFDQTAVQDFSGSKESSDDKLVKALKAGKK